MVNAPSAATGNEMRGSGLIQYPPSGARRYMKTRCVVGATRPDTRPAMGVSAPGAGKVVMVMDVGVLLGAGDGDVTTPGTYPLGNTACTVDDAASEPGSGAPSTAQRCNIDNNIAERSTCQTTFPSPLGKDVPSGMTKMCACCMLMSPGGYDAQSVKSNAPAGDS